MFKRKSIVYTLAVTTLLLGTIFGAYAVSAQTQTPPTTPPMSGPMTGPMSGPMSGTMPGPKTDAVTTTVESAAPATQTAQAVDSAQMAQAMTTLMDQMEAMMAAAPDDAARQQMIPAMMNMLNGMMGLNQAMLNQMQAMPGPEQQAMAGPMMEAMTRMTGMMGQMQPMMGSGMTGQGAPGMMGGTAPISGTMPMSGTQSVGPMTGAAQMGQMQMGQMMGMMGQMMQMMGGGMMGQSGAGMMNETAPISGTLPMSGTQSFGPMTGTAQMGKMQMGQMMGMMGQMMQMMGGGMMGQSGAGMMGEGIGQPGAMTHRQAEVAKRGAQIMPFDLGQTTHIFKNLDNGGLQQVIVKAGADAAQVSLIQTHLSQEAENFRVGNFSNPAQIHGNAMPGLAVLREHASEIDVRYTALDNGAQLEYITTDPVLVAAIHDWFDAQLSDHGMDATNAMPSTQTPIGGAQAAQSVEGGSVTVQVTPLTLTDVTATTLDFEVALETHSVELTYDLAQLAVLRDNLGNEYQPATWIPDQSSGHHVKGLLSFAERATILQTGVTSLELDVTGIAGIPSRLFQWTVDK